MGRGKPKKAEASIAKSSTAKERKPRKSAGCSKASKGPATSLQTLKSQKQDVVKKHLKADRTRKAYDAHVNRGREFLERQCKDSDELEESRRNPTQSSETADHSGDGMQVDSGDTPATTGTSESNMSSSWADPEFALAFSEKPNKYSPEALVLYLTQKGFVEGCSQSRSQLLTASILNSKSTGNNSTSN